MCLVYCKWWIRCPLPASAPLNDLDLLVSIANYPDKIVAEAAMKAVKRHLWYLTEEMVPLALFSPDLSNKKKDELSKYILKLNDESNNEKIVTNRHGTSFGKPNFPTIKEDYKQLSLLKFVGKDSLGFFKILGLEWDFLKCPSSMWPNIESFKIAEKVVNHIHVVNDAAERGVKIANDFLNSAKSEKNLSNNSSSCGE